MKYKKKFSMSEKILELVRIGLENTYTRGVCNTFEPTISNKEVLKLVVHSTA